MLRLPGEEGQPELLDAVFDRAAGAHVEPLVQQALLLPDYFRAEARHPGGQPGDPGVELVIGHHLVDDAPPLRRAGVDRLAGEQ